MTAFHGGGADKVGNRYEAKWGVSALLGLINEDFDLVRIEKPGQTWAEFSTEKDGYTTWYQVKLKGATATGTIAGIEPVLKAFGPKLHAGDTCQYISGGGCEEVDELAGRARDADDFQDFNTEALKAAGRRKDFDRLGKIWESSSPEQTFERLKRLEVATQDEVRLVKHNELLASTLLNGDAGTNTGVLFTIYFDHVHQVITRAKLLRLLAEKQIHLFQGPSNGIKPRWMSRGQIAARAIVEKLVAIGKFGALGPVPGSDYSDWETAARGVPTPLPLYTDAIAEAHSLRDALETGDPRVCMARVASTLEQIEKLFEDVSDQTSKVQDRWDYARTRVDERTFEEQAVHPASDVTSRVQASDEYKRMRKVANELDFWVAQQDLVREIEVRDLPKLKTIIAVRDN